MKHRAPIHRTIHPIYENLSLGLAAALLLTAAFIGCQRSSNRSEHVEIVIGSASPTPATTIELRFEAAMVKPGEIGTAAARSPLVLEPPVAGSFTWLSTRSGVFTPSEPLALDTRYTLTLSPGLTEADGQPACGRLRWTLTTPPFGVTAFAPRHRGLDATSDPEIKLVFNADVAAKAAEPFLSFRDASGQRVPVEARRGTVEEAPARYEMGGEDSLRTWSAEFYALRRADHHQDAGEPNPTNEVPNLLIVTPSRFLPVGKGWRLEVRGGLPSTERNLQSRQSAQVAIGDLTPFVVEQVTPQNLIYSGASIGLSFSKPVPPKLTNGLDWLVITPQPSNLTISVWNRLVTLSGGFQSQMTYTLALNRDLRAIEPFTLAGSNSFQVRMPPIAPRLYFPACARDQLAGGNRQFPLLAINVPSIELRAKLLDPHTAIHALRAYETYFLSARERREYRDWEESYGPVPYNLVPGHTIFRQHLDLGTERDTAKTVPLSWDQLLAGHKTGMAFVEAQSTTHNGSHNGAPGAQALIQLTDLGLVCKRASSGVDVFVFSHSSGQPVPGATAILYSDENEPLSQALTDASGLAHLSAPTNAEWVAVQSGDDFHAVAMDQEKRWRYSFQLPMSGSMDQEDLRRVMLFSDRNLYRPGEEMHLEALVRDWAGDLVVPAGLAGCLECLDARGRSFFKTNALFSASGAYSVLVPLPTGTRGGYTARLLLGQHPYIYTFQVQDFQPNAFEIALPPISEVAAGQTVEVPVSARYLFGKSLSRAQVKWSLDARDAGFRPEGFERFKFTRAESEWRYGRGASGQCLNGQGALTGSNRFVVAPELNVNPTAPQPRAVSLLVEVTDLNQQTVSRRLEFVQHSSEFYLGLAQEAEVLTAGSSLPLEVLAVGTDGRPWAAPVPAHMTLQHVSWESVRVQGAGKTMRYRNEWVITNLLEQDITVQPIQGEFVVPALAGTHGQGGRAADSASAEEVGVIGPESFRGTPNLEIHGQRLLDLPALPAGDYLLEMRAKDTAGRAVICSREFQVSAPAPTSWSYRNGTQLSLKPDRKAYTPGQTAEILVEAPFSGTAYVTVEREKVLRSFVCRLEGNAPAVRVPLEAQDVPNVFVSAVLVRGADECPHHVKVPEYRMGSCELAVSEPASRLAVTVTPAATNYLPAQPVDVTVQVADGAGKAVSGAELVLYAVDDGILGLSDYQMPDPYGFFYASRPLGVLSTVSLPNLLAEDPEQLSFDNKGYLAGGGGLESVRKNFLACAVWRADLCSDSGGMASVRFTAPDSLTRYRVFAVAFKGSCFGSGQSAIQVAKPLMIEPALPHFASITDRLVARGVVHNQTAHAGDTLVSLEVDDKVEPGESGRILTRRVLVPAHGSAVVEFPVQFTETGEAKWLWKARFAQSSPGVRPSPTAATSEAEAAPNQPGPTEPVQPAAPEDGRTPPIQRVAFETEDGQDTAPLDFTDSVQSILEVGHIAPVLREALLTRVTTAQTNLLEHANPQLLGGSGQMTICVANSRLNELGEAAAQLLHYPYGCAEQTGSSLLPWFVLSDAPGGLPLLRRGTNEVSQAIRAGVTRLFSMQTSSGGLGYWPGASEPMLWASAYGGLVLAQAQWHGATIPKAEFDALFSFLSGQLRSISADSGDASDACLALYALAVAGRSEPAYHERFFARREGLSAEDRALLALSIAEAHGPTTMIGELLQPNSRSHRMDEARFGCGAREQAIRLLAWTLYRPQDPLVDRLVEDLMREQKEAHWGTTQGDAWALLALTEYARRVEGTVQPALGELRWEERTIPFRLDNQARLFSQTLALTQTADAALSLLNPSKSRLYTTVVIEARPAETPQPRQDRGISLERRYDRLDDENQTQDLHGLRVGDRVLVTLRLSLREPARYVVIDDALPAVLEAVNPEFRTQEARASALGGDGEWWASDFREMRKDRCLYFADWVPAGSYRLHYVARVRAAGSVTAPSAKVEEMYHPERCGLSGSQVITSAALE